MPSFRAYHRRFTDIASCAHIDARFERKIGPVGYSLIRATTISANSSIRKMTRSLPVRRAFFQA